MATAGNLGLAVWNSSGTLLWSQSWPDRHVGRVLALSTTALLVCESLKISSYNATTGALNWQETLDSNPGIISKPVVSSDGSTIALISTDLAGRVFVLNAATGAVTATFPTAAQDLGIASNGSLIAVANTNQLTLYSVTSGFQWVFADDSYVRFPRFSPDNSKIVCTSDLGMVDVLNTSGSVLYERDMGALCAAAWVSSGSYSGDLILASWEGSVYHLTAGSYAQQWSTLLTPTATDMRNSLMTGDGAPVTKMTNWSNALATNYPLTPNLLSPSTAFIWYLDNTSTVSWFQGTNLTNPYTTYDASPLVDGSSTPPSTPWISENSIFSLSSSFPATNNPASNQGHIILDAWNTMMQVTGITLWEDPAHPESWIRDCTLDYWNVPTQSWVTGPALFSDQATHSHAINPPIQSPRVRITTPPGAPLDPRLGEIVLQGSMLGCSHPDVVAGHNTCVLFDENTWPLVGWLSLGGNWAIQYSDAYSGAACIAKNGTGLCSVPWYEDPFNSDMPDWNMKVVQTPQNANEFRYLQFAWKAVDSTVTGITLEVGNLNYTSGGLLASIYCGSPDCGFGYDTTQPWTYWPYPTTVNDQVSTTVPTSWTLVTVDLWQQLQSYGGVNITTMALGSIGGSGKVEFDAIKLFKTDPNGTPYTPPTVSSFTTDQPIYTAPASMVLTAQATDTNSGGSITKVEFYNGVQLIGTATSSPYSYTWTAVPVGSYTLTARAYDNFGLETNSSAVSVNVGTLPSAGMLLWLHADAISGVGPEAPVTSWNDCSGNGRNALYVNPNGETAPTYVATDFNNLPAVRFNGHNLLQISSFPLGPYTIAAVFKTNASEQIVYEHSDNMLLNNNANFLFTSTNSTVSVKRNGIQTGKDIVESNAGTWAASPGVPLLTVDEFGGTDASETFAINTSPQWLNENYVGNLNNTTVYTDYFNIGEREWFGSLGFTGDLAELVIYNHVLSSADLTTLNNALMSKYALVNPPTATLTAPLNGAQYTAPATIALAATAGVGSGSISKVEFYNGTTLLGTSTSSPYSYNWSSVAAGNYSVTAIAYSSNNLTTPTATANISVLTPCAAPTFNPTAGTYTTSTTVTISTSTGGATIMYTTNGTTPSSTVGTVYSSPVSITATATTLQAIAYESGYANSTVSSGIYTIQCATPTFSPAAGTFTTSTSVTISTTTGGASIRYTTNGTTPSSTVGTVYSSAVSLTSTSTLQAIAYETGLTSSALASGVYTIQCATPAFNPATGTFTTSTSVTISTATGGASIRYTTNGTTPSSTVGTVYSSAVSLTSTSTLQAIAYETGLTNSAVASGVYTIQCAAPAFSPAAGTYTSAMVTITSATSGASIRYTTNGTTPSSTVGTVYSSPVAISATETLQAIAYKTGLSNSAVTSGAYTIYIGTTSAGGTNTAITANEIRGTRFQAGSAMTINHINLDIGTSVSGNIQCAIYSDSSSKPSSLLKGTNALNNPGTGWQTFTLTSSQALTSGTYYWLLFWSAANYSVQNTTSSGSSWYRSLTYGSWPSSAGSGTTETRTWSVYGY